MSQDGRGRTLLPLLVLALLAGGLGASEKHAEAATASAEAWLALVDAGQYGESWEEAAKLFKGAVTREKWESVAAGVRKPQGSLVSRKVKSAQYAESLPGAPDGQYVVIQFETVFTNKKQALETVTPRLDPDGQWRVSGYFIK